jgi:pimeloyl-ACP methyl ester carboxylesterase
MPTVDGAGIRFSFEEEGAGRPVLLLHSTASGAMQWVSLTGHLRGRYRVLAVDLPGYGATVGIASRDAPGLAGHAAVVRAVADHCGEPVHLVGHSFGGAVALKAALAAPESIRSLTVIEPVAFNVLRSGTDVDRHLAREVDALAGLIAACVADDAPDAALAHFIDFWNGEGAWSVLPARTRAHLSAQVGAIVDDFAAGRGEIWPAEACRTIAQPTLAVMGMQSKPHSQRVTEMVAEAIPGGRLHMVLDAGHMLPLTHPRLLNPMIAAFLAEADLRRSVSPRAYGRAA